MKARVKETGKIVDVIAISDYINEFGQIIGEYKDANGTLYTSYDLDFYIEEGITIPDYWTRLEHQYAGMAMQGLLSSGKLNILVDNSDVLPKGIAIVSREFARALVKKVRYEEENPKEL